MFQECPKKKVTAGDGVFFVLEINSGIVNEFEIDTSWILNFSDFFETVEPFLLNKNNMKILFKLGFPNLSCLFSTRSRRGVAQPGSAPVLGRGRKFESCRPDH